MAFALDTSGSVGPAVLSRAARLAEAVLGALPPGAEAAVFTFDDEARLVLRRTADRAAVRRALLAARVSGRNTALNDALYDASRYLREASAARVAIVLITDGRDEDSATELEDGVRVAQASAIPVFTVGVGRVQERSLRRIAKLTGGTYSPLVAAAPAALAARIAGAGQPPPPTARAGEALPAASPPVASPAAASLAAAPTADDGPGAGFPWRALVLATLGTAALLGAYLLVRRRGKEGACCAACGRPLPTPFSRCAFCASANTIPGAAIALPNVSVATVAGELSPTVQARMNITEEFLEKTITLQTRPVLRITRGPGAGASYPLSESTATSIGRAKANDIMLEDVSISSQHCRVRPENGRFVVHDLQSTNGTFVNDRRVTAQALTEGDVIQVGETALQLKLEQRRQ
ncbi:MAG TPA: FHA domain-containing protein [Vicinamibacteria bacterium]